MDKICIICRNSFTTSYRQATTCCKECNLAYRRSRRISVIKKCVICYKEYRAYGNATTCSKVCSKHKKNVYNKTLRKNIIKKCIICSKEYRVYGVALTCSTECSIKSVHTRLNKRYHNDIEFKMRDTLRSRLKHALKNNQKIGSAVRDLGCTIPELKSYLESKFLPGMSWGNWSLNGWHIDHIKPLSKFDLTDREQFLKACHYSNLQPMWANDNRSKRDHYIESAP